MSRPQILQSSAQQMPRSSRHTASTAPRTASIAVTALQVSYCCASHTCKLWWALAGHVTPPGGCPSRGSHCSSDSHVQNAHCVKSSSPDVLPCGCVLRGACCNQSLQWQCMLHAVCPLLCLPERSCANMPCQQSQCSLRVLHQQQLQQLPRCWISQRCLRALWGMHPLC